MAISVAPVYAAILAILLIILSARVIMRRAAARISMGDGGDKELTKRMRVHANCAEYVPLGVLLLLMIDLMNAAPRTLHGLGVMLVLGRVLHAAGMSATPQIPVLRITGMLLTFTMLALSAALALYLALVEFSDPG